MRAVSPSMETTVPLRTLPCRPPLPPNDSCSRAAKLSLGGVVVAVAAFAIVDRVPFLAIPAGRLSPAVLQTLRSAPAPRGAAGRLLIVGFSRPADPTPSRRVLGQGG